MSSQYIVVTPESSQRFTNLLAKGNWKFEENRIKSRFEFTDFISAFGFMAQVALKAEKLNHHPNWSNVYNTVDITLFTHEKSCVTEHDLELAEFCDSIYAKLK